MAMMMYVKIKINLHTFNNKYDNIKLYLHCFKLILYSNVKNKFFQIHQNN